MHHTEAGDAQYIFSRKVDADQLFNEVKQAAVPFHRWHNWLEQRFDSLKKLEQPDPVEAVPRETDSAPEKVAEQAAGGYGIFSRIYQTLWRGETEDDKAERERKQLEKERRLLYGA